MCYEHSHFFNTRKNLLKIIGNDVITASLQHHMISRIHRNACAIFIDGHEHDDVIEYHKIFLRRMVKIGFLHFTNAPTESSQKAIPMDVGPPTLERWSKTIVFFHDESIFSANEDQNKMWGTKGQKISNQRGRFWDYGL